MNVHEAFQGQDQSHIQKPQERARVNEAEVQMAWIEHICNTLSDEEKMAILEKLQKEPGISDDRKDFIEGAKSNSDRRQDLIFENVFLNSAYGSWFREVFCQHPRYNEIMQKYSLDRGKALEAIVELYQEDAAKH